MQEMDCVEIVVEREKYAKEGIHKGMQGWICDPRNISDSWLVNVPQYGEKNDIATISIKEEDLKLLPKGMDTRINEQIKAQFDDLNQKVKPMEDETLCGESKNNSDYLI